jgi:arsenite/tail-anchored protein-transporting ATPase
VSRFIFLSGKGGVGKTSMACSTGLYYALNNHKTLIVTTDPAANLTDVFEQEIGHKVTAITGVPNLWAMEIDPEQATKDYKENALAPLRDLFDEELFRISEEQLSGPCTEEMASFDKFIDFMGDSEYEIVIFDTAPTGHTIRLLELPVDWSKHIEESSKGSGQTCMGPVQLIQESKQKYDDAIAKLRNQNVTDFVFVVQPERTSIEETKRSSDELKGIGINTTQIVVNGLIPKEEAINPFFKQRYDMQQKHLNQVQDIFDGVPIKTMELFDQEIKGVTVLSRCAEKLFNGGYLNE